MSRKDCIPFFNFGGGIPGSAHNYCELGLYSIYRNDFSMERPTATSEVGFVFINF